MRKLCPGKKTIYNFIYNTIYKREKLCRGKNYIQFYIQCYFQSIKKKKRENYVQKLNI